MKSLLEAKISKKFIMKYRIVIQFLCLFIIFLGTGWVWHYSNYEDGELKLYGLQAIAEIIVAVFETIATFLMITSIKQNGEANREMKKMNEALQYSMKAQTEVLIKQQEFYALQMSEKQAEIRKAEKAKILNRYLSYMRNFLFAYNRMEKFDGVDTKKLQQDIKKNIETIDNKESMLKQLLEIKLTPNQNVEQYIFMQEVISDKTGKLLQKIVFTKNDKDVKEKFDCLLREYKYKLRLKLHPILKEYFKNFEENEELQELCG